MSDKKHIDRLFQEKLKNFEATPSKNVWSNINKELNQGQKDRKVIPLWLKLTGAAILIGGLFILGNSLLDENNNIDTPETIVNSDSQDQKDNTNDSNSVIEDDFSISTEKNEDVVDSKELDSEENLLRNETESSVANNTNKDSENINNKLSNKNKNNSFSSTKNDTKIINENTSDKEEASNNPILNKEKVKELLNPSKNTEEVIAENNNDTNEDKNEEELTSEEKEEENAIEEALANNEDETDKKEEENIRRWSITPNISPVYFNTLSEGSPIHPQFVNNTKTGDITMSYGLITSYAINDKLKIRTGVNKLDIGYRTDDVIAYNDVSSDPPNDGHPKPKLKLNEASQNLGFMTANAYYFSDTPTILSEQFRGSIDQDLGFIEVPLEIEYTLIDEKINLRVIGGGSALFLNDNKVYITSGSKTTLIGEATNISKTSFTANLGLGVDFKFSEKVRFNLEPIFKYQFNTFNDVSGNFKPYIIGVYSGFIIKL